MRSAISIRFYLCLILTVVCFNVTRAQSDDEKSDKRNNNRFTFFELRGSNSIDIAAGSAFVEGDYEDSEYDLYFRVGYKHHITSHLNLNFTYNKYNVSIDDIYYQGFMSFDLNLEFFLSPYRKFSPFLFVGGGYNAANYFDMTSTKAQGGLGFEIIIAPGVGLKLFGEYNYMLSDEIDGLIEGDTDDTLIRAGLGLNMYFGGNKKKEALRKKLKTVINSNPIISK